MPSSAAGLRTSGMGTRPSASARSGDTRNGGWRISSDGATAAAEAAIAEFGRPQVILAAFTRASPARRAARRLLATGPIVACCWAAELITSRAWRWPVAVEARMMFGVTLIIVTGLLAAAALGGNYRSVSRAGTAGCIGLAALDSTMLIAVPFAVPAVAWPLILAATASVVRLAMTARTLRPVLAG